MTVRCFDELPEFLFECWLKFWTNGSRSFGRIAAGIFGRTRPEFQMNGRWIFGRNVVGVSDNVETGSTF